MLAVVWATKNYRCYLLGRKFTVYTDHEPLTGNFRVKDPTSRLIRFHHKLSEYDCILKYKAGKTNVNADALSRIPTITSEQEENTSERICLAVTRAQKALQKSDKEDSSNNSTEPDIEHTDNNGDDSNKTCTDERILQQTEYKDSKNTRETIETPDEILTILKDYHDSPFGGHQGVINTYKRIRQRYVWPKMFRDISRYIRRCPKCQKMKSSPETKMPMIITDTCQTPFDKVYLDIVGPLQDSNLGNKYILTFQDNLTKFVDFYPLPNQEAETVAHIFYEQIITRYRIPKKLVTDQGTNFLSKLFKQVCKLLKIEKLQTTAYHPQSNGALERAHRPLIEYLRTICDENPRSWDQYLRTAAFVYNNSIHEGTKFTPMDCLFGFTSDIPSNLKRTTEPVYDHENYFFILRHKLQTTYAIARKNLINSKKNSKNYYDQGVKIKTFHVGNKVLIKNENRQHKLSEIWKGPYTIVKITNPTNSVVLIKKKNVTIHNNRLKHYYDSEDESLK